MFCLQLNTRAVSGKTPRAPSAASPDLSGSSSGVSPLTGRPPAAALTSIAISGVAGSGTAAGAEKAKSPPGPNTALSSSAGSRDEPPYSAAGAALNVLKHATFVGSETKRPSSRATESAANAAIASAGTSPAGGGAASSFMTHSYQHAIADESSDADHSTQLLHRRGQSGGGGGGGGGNSGSHTLLRPVAQEHEFERRAHGLDAPVWLHVSLCVWLECG